MNNNDLNRFLVPGAAVSITLEANGSAKYNFSAIYIGNKPTKYVVFELTQQAMDKITETESASVNIIVRAISDTEYGHVIAFKCNVIQAISAPALQVFMSAPTSIASKPIREHERYKLNLNAAVRLREHYLQGYMIDFSVSGCGLLLNDTGVLEIGNEVSIDSELNRMLPSDLVSRVVSIRKQATGFIVGIQFESPILLTHDLKRELLEQSFKSGNLG
ncbi:PilZ domain-containing protein [Vibrio maerlii]|uniref:PilZ domain-containing protein n=1 Tax=Vibrio maerlii TaxID=2231648 RepID=UPI000E3BC648|nr:PilZ domain-containing protein [Vibrio maerlii]